MTTHSCEAPKEPLEKQQIIVGRFGKTHGVKGWIRVQSFTDPAKNLFHYHDWRDDKNLPIEVAQHQQHSSNWIVKLNHIDTPEDAQQFVNKTIHIDKSQLPQLEHNEYYWNQLIGLKVIDQHNTSIGIVKDMMETGSNDVFIVINDRTETPTKHLIPYTNNVVKQINLPQQEIHIDWE